MCARARPSVWHWAAKLQYISIERKMRQNGVAETCKPNLCSWLQISIIPYHHNTRGQWVCVCVPVCPGTADGYPGDTLKLRVNKEQLDNLLKVKHSNKISPCVNFDFNDLLSACVRVCVQGGLFTLRYTAALSSISDPSVCLLYITHTHFNISLFPASLQPIKSLSTSEAYW